MLPRVMLLLAAALGASAQSNTELARLFAEDQADRAHQFTLTPADVSAMADRDAPRLKRVHELAEAGALMTPEDYVRAAFLLQHGRKPEDFLLAHVLGSIAAKMDGSGAWIAAASLDRYLLSIGRAQVFGLTLDDHQPFDRTQLTDRMRLAFCAPSIADRAKLMESIAKDPAHPLLFDPCMPDPQALISALMGKWKLIWKGADGRFHDAALNVTRKKDGDVDLDFSGTDYPSNAENQIQFGRERLTIRVKGDVFDLAIHGDTMSGQWSSGNASAAVAAVR